MEAIRIAVATVSLATLIQVLPASAGAAEPHDHWRVAEKICQTGLTPEVTAGHEEFVAAWDQKGTTTEVTHLAEYTGFRPRVFNRNVRTVGGPHASQLGRPVSLDMAYANCFQAR
jgi:hypothetical protein